MVVNLAAYQNLDDHLGTTQMELGSGGWPLWQGQFTPFGQEIIGGNTTNYLGPQPADGTAMHYKFTGKERDTESGLDHFQFRSYASTMGRWTSPDPAGMMAVDLTDPQSLNRYAYVQNNPLSFVDPLGLDCAHLNGKGTTYDHVDQKISSGGCTKSGGYWVDGGLKDVTINQDTKTVTLTGILQHGADGDVTTTATHEIATTADVGWYLNTGLNPAGHIAIGVGGGQPYGLNPKSDLGFFLGQMGNRAYAVVPGKVAPQRGGQLKKMVHVRITGPQAALLQFNIQAGIGNPPNYTLYGPGPACDCAGWAQQLLGDAGINTGPPEPRPESFIQQLDYLQPTHP